MRWLDFSSAVMRCALASLLVLGVGCQKKTEAPAPAETAKKELGAPEGQLDIVAWPGYIERGDTDKSYDWVTQFEKDTGCKVNVKTAGTSDEMVSLMTQGGYDLVTASGDASLRLIRGNTVQPVDISLIPSYGTVDSRLQEAPWHFVDGKHYGTPYQWGPNVLMYNTASSRKRRPRGTWCSSLRSSPTASPTRAASRHTTARSTSRTPRSISWRRNPSSGSRTPTS